MSLFYNKNNEWYHENVEKYEKLKEFVDGIIHNLINTWAEEENLFIEQTDSRIKERMSFLDKLKKKHKIEAKDIEDFFGSRIVCYTKTDVENVCKLLEGPFTMLEKDDKSKKTGIYQTGYKSVHLRLQLPKDQDNNYMQIAKEQYEEFKTIVFEIQVRTVFQDAWAVISHKKKYKFGGFIPFKLTSLLDTFSSTLSQLDEQLDLVVNETIAINNRIPEAIKEIEDKYPDVLEYIYTQKIYGDLNFVYLESKKDLTALQIELFDSSVDIHKRYDNVPELKELLENILDEEFNLYDLARNRIIFNEPSRKKVTDYMRKSLTATFSQNDKIIFEPTITSFATIWPDVNYHSDFQNPTNPKFLEIDKSQDIDFRTRLDFMTIMLDTVRLYNIQNDGYHIINRSSYFISFKDIPSGTYRINVKTAYEPSGDNRAWFEDLICIK